MDATLNDRHDPIVQPEPVHAYFDLAAPTFLPDA